MHKVANLLGHPMMLTVRIRVYSINIYLVISSVVVYAEKFYSGNVQKEPTHVIRNSERCLVSWLI